MDQLLASLSSGGLVGFTLGLIGGGGSILATPLLMYVVGLGEPHAAIGTGALAVSANAYASFVGHARSGHVWWRCAALFAAVGSLAALAGSALGKAIDGQRLLFLFGVLMVAVGAAMLRPRKDRAGPQGEANLKTCLATGAAAAVAGTASGFFGIGGGFLIVPALIFATGMPTISAIGSSLLAVGSFGLTTALSYAASGLVDWRIALEFIAGGALGGVGGMVLAQRLAGNKHALNRIFASLIFVVAAYVLYRSGRTFL